MTLKSRTRRCAALAPTKDNITHTAATAPSGPDGETDSPRHFGGRRQPHSVGWEAHRLHGAHLHRIVPQLPRRRNQQKEVQQ